MLATFLSITPIFLVMGLGVGLRRLPLFDDGLWRGIDRLAFYVLYPVLLFATILKADFAGLSLVPVFSSALLGLAIIAASVLALWPVFKARGMPGPTFSTIFQASVRWNGFIALAIAEKLFPPEGAAMVGLLMALVIIPINLASISAVVAWSGRARTVSGYAGKILLNPMIVSVAAALCVRALPFGLPGPVMDAIDLVARGALGMGLMAIGAGLKLDQLARPPVIAFLPALMKLIAYPLIVLGLAITFGLPAAQWPWLVLCASVPTAMNGYVVAREMGGDAETYALAVTIQTAIAFVSIPLLQAFVTLLSG